MSELRGRSRRLRKRGSISPNGSSQHASALRKRRQIPSPYGNGYRNSDSNRNGNSRGSQRNSSSERHGNRQLSQSRTQPHGLVQSSPGAIVKASSRYQSRDGHRIPLGPDTSRRRRQVGAYAPAFNGRQSSGSWASPYGQESTSSQQFSRREASSYFPGAQAAGTYHPVQRLSPRPVSPPTARKRSTPSVRKPPKPTPPIVYAVRLLILGVGIGAIAGTVISTVDSSQRDATVTAPSEGVVSANGERVDNTSGGAPPSALDLPDSGRSLVTPLQLGQEMGALLTELQTMAGAWPELNPGVFIYDLDTTNYLSLNGENPFSAASTIKVPVLVAFFQDVEAGRIKLDDVLTMKENDIATGSGDMQFQPVGTEYTALETATKMIIISDNTATNMLIRKLGGAHALNRRFQSWGLTSTAIRNPLPDLEGTNTTSPRDLVTLMTLVSYGELLSLRSRDQMLHIMERTQTNTLLPQGNGPGAQIAHKTGDIGSMVGDVGLVDMPNGKRYSITVLVQRPHNDSRAQELIRQIARKAYTTLEAGEELAPIPTNDLPSSEEDDRPDTNAVTSDLEDENPEFFGIQ